MAFDLKDVIILVWCICQFVLVMFFFWICFTQRKEKKEFEKNITNFERYNQNSSVSQNNHSNGNNESNQSLMQNQHQN
ncbi:hypothetical protein ABPG73_016671 [Tetrahymena malaccensis]